MNWILSEPQNHETGRVQQPSNVKWEWNIQDQVEKVWKAAQTPVVPGASTLLPLTQLVPWATWGFPSNG